MKKNVFIARIALLTSLSVVLGYLESLLPGFSPVPYVKPGFSNIIVLFTLFMFDAKSAFLVAILKVGLVSLMFGGVSGFLFSLSGALLSLIIEIILKKTGLFSLVAVSSAGGIFHNIGQILCASVLIGKGAFYYILPFAAFGGISGILTGICTLILLRKGKNIIGKK